MISGVLTLTGPDMFEELEDIFADLGRRHKILGCKVEYFEIHGLALRKALKDILGELYTSEVDNSWEIVFGALAAGITAAM